MADGTNYAKAIAPAFRSLMGAEWDGKVRAIHEEYTFASAAIGTVVNVGILKKGEVFLACFVASAALGASSTIQLGDSDDDDRYFTAVSTASAVEAVKGAQTGVGYKATADTVMVLKTAGAEASGKVELVILKAVSN